MFSLQATPPSPVRQVFRASRRIARALPFFLSRVPAGFPSPADDYLEGELDLNELLIQHPAATFFVRLAGDSMVNAGLFDGDIVPGVVFARLRRFLGLCGEIVFQRGRDIEHRAGNAATSATSS